MTIAGPATAVVVASTATVPALAANAPAPAPATSSAIRSAVGPPAPAPPAAAAAHEASGSGTTAVAAARKVSRARCTSWRTAPSETPSSRATSSWLRPSTAIRSSASRWRSGSAAKAVSVSRTTARRSISSWGASPPRSDSRSSA